MMKFTEQDWRLFRKKSGSWQENYMDRLNKEYIELLSADTLPSEKFWELSSMLKRDKKKYGVQLEMSRSKLVQNIIFLLYENVIEFEELEEFSDE